MLHAVMEMAIYLAVKLPLYAYESVEDVKESVPYHRIVVHGWHAKTRRLLGF